MTENDQADETQPILNIVNEWITARNIERVNGDHHEISRVKIPVSDDQAIPASIVILPSGIVLFTILDINIKEEQLADLAILANAINQRMPFGSFAVDPKEAFLFYRDSTRAAFGTIAPDSLDKVFNTAIFNIRAYQTLLKAVGEGLLNGQAAIDKLESGTDS